MELLIESLEADNLTDKPLSHTTKVGYKKTLRKFYKWLLGNNKHYPELVDWIDTYDEMKEIPAITREEAEKIADTLKIRDKAIIMFLFDSGVRAEELLNIKILDLTKTDDIYKVRIVFSKTRRRTIHLPICSRYLDHWLQEYNPISNQEYIFPIHYDTLRRKIRIWGDSVLKRRISPHVLRHSSVTYYANLLNHQQLCYRYGWSMASEMPNRYIDREGIFERESVDMVKSNDYSILEKQNQLFREKLLVVEEFNSTLTKQVTELKNQIDTIFGGKEFIRLLESVKANTS